MHSLKSKYSFREKLQFEHPESNHNSVDLPFVQTRAHSTFQKTSQITPTAIVLYLQRKKAINRFNLYVLFTHFRSCDAISTWQAVEMEGQIPCLFPFMPDRYGYWCILWASGSNLNAFKPWLKLAVFCAISGNVKLNHFDYMCKIEQANCLGRT